MRSERTWARTGTWFFRLDVGLHIAIFFVVLPWDYLGRPSNDLRQLSNDSSPRDDPRRTLDDLRKP